MNDLCKISKNKINKTCILENEALTQQKKCKFFKGQYGAQSLVVSCMGSFSNDVDIIDEEIRAYWNKDWWSLTQTFQNTIYKNTFPS